MAFLRTRGLRRTRALFVCQSCLGERGRRIQPSRRSLKGRSVTGDATHQPASSPAARPPGRPRTAALCPRVLRPPRASVPRSLPVGEGGAGWAWDLLGAGSTVPRCVGSSLGSTRQRRRRALDPWTLDSSPRERAPLSRHPHLWRCSRWDLSQAPGTPAPRRSSRRRPAHQPRRGPSPDTRRPRDTESTTSGLPLPLGTFWA